MNPMRAVRKCRQSITCVARLADALVVVGQLDAVQAVARVTGVGQALVDVSLTAVPSEARGAVALVAAHAVHTRAVVQTLGGAPGPGWGGAVVLIDLTQDTCRHHKTQHYINKKPSYGDRNPNNNAILL